MSRFVFRTAALAALMFGVASTTAAAQSSPGAGAGADGHYEWRLAPQFGPRTPPRAPKRVWVPDNPRLPDRDCGMMRSRSADCMAGMMGRSKKPSAG